MNIQVCRIRKPTFLSTLGNIQGENIQIFLNFVHSLPDSFSCFDFLNSSFLLILIFLLYNNDGIKLPLLILLQLIPLPGLALSIHQELEGVAAWLHLQEDSPQGCRRGSGLMEEELGLLQGELRGNSQRQRSL